MKPSSIATRWQALHDLRQIQAYSMGIPAGKALFSTRSCPSWSRLGEEVMPLIVSEQVVNSDKPMG